MATFELSHITVDYKDAAGGVLRALDNVSLQIAAGQSVALIGPSGCGKSTLLRVLCGLQAPSAGSVRCDGDTLTGVRQETALILQDYGLLPWKTVYQNAELGLLIRGMSADERKNRTSRALAHVGLSGFEKSFPRELSGGMQQRVALARVIALQSDLLLMDEPLSALDALLREKLQEVLLDLWKSQGHAQVLVTHSIEEAVFLGRRIVVMSPRPGRIVDVIDNPGMGTVEYRGTDEFFSQCKKVRAAMDEQVDGVVADGLAGGVCRGASMDGGEATTRD